MVGFYFHIIFISHSLFLSSPPYITAYSPNKKKMMDWWKQSFITKFCMNSTISKAKHAHCHIEFTKIMDAINCGCSKAFWTTHATNHLSLFYKWKKNIPKIVRSTTINILKNKNKLKPQKQFLPHSTTNTYNSLMSNIHPIIPSETSFILHPISLLCSF